jgi:hypothetical protein
MRSRLLFFIAICIFNLILAQNYNKDIQGAWVTVFKEMKDGSTYIPKSCNPFPNKFIFVDDKLCINKQDNLCLDFKISKNFIKTSESSGYIIEKVNSDSLVIVQSIVGAEDDKLERMYFVRQEKVLDQQKKIHTEKNIVANSLFFPPMKKNLSSVLNEFFKRKYKYVNLNFVGSIIIYPQQNKVSTEIKYSSDNNKERIDYIKYIIDHTFDIWDLKDFSNYESVTLPFILEIKNENIGDGSQKEISLSFLSQNINDFNCINGILYQNLKKSNELFIEGINATKRKKYENAISFFNESYTLNNSNIDNLYNIATVYAMQNDIFNACKTWEKLKNMNQIQGKKLFQQNCKQ